MAGSDAFLHRPARTHLGPYRLLDVLGEGGTARVYLAEHTVIGKRVAIKTLLPQLAGFAPAHAMFREEARLACAIQHPNLVDVYDFATDDRGNPYCVMELASGQTLAERLKTGPLPLSRCLDLAICITDAVAAVHAAGVLHRDIKTENVVLIEDGRRLSPKLIDFGIATRLVPETLDSGEVIAVGTPRTMSPEQISRDPVDERTDIWATGIVLYEMMTATCPFPTGASVRDDFVAILTEPPRPLDLGFPEELRSIVGACLSKDPEDRPPTAAALREQLERVRADYSARQETIERALVESEALGVLEELEAELAA